MKTKYLILFLLISTKVFCQNTVPDSTTNPENQDAFFDSIFKSQLDKKVFQGAAFVFVQNGKVLYKKGYGIYDAKKNTPVNPDSSIFYTASVSKIFASLSLMQLQEKGKCNMTDDANKYFDKFKLDNPFSTPVTLKNLVTHTAGFEDRFTGGIVKNASEIIPLEEYFSKRMPAIVMQPGTQISYSNHSAALAGLIVQKISGISYDEYVQQNIFTPLGMLYSSFFQPPPTQLQKIIPKNGRPQPFYNPYPAASCVTTASDMGKLIVALLSTNNSGFISIIFKANFFTAMVSK